MPRPAASIQAEIDVLEARLSSAAGLTDSVSSDGTSVRHADYAALTKRLDSLYIQLGRANGTSPMIVRGRIDGLRGSTSNG